MDSGDAFLILALVIVATSFIYIYLNMESLDCYMDYSMNGVMGNIEYSFEPAGSIYGKTRIYRFVITSYDSRLEYFGMEVRNGEEILFFENMTNPEGGTLSTVLEIEESEDIEVKRFFKKKCYPETDL